MMNNNIRKQLKHLAFILALSFTTVGITFSEIYHLEDPDHFAFGLHKINDHLFQGKKEDDLWFVMERIDTAVPGSRLSFWQDYVKKEYSNHAEYLSLLDDKMVPLKLGFIGLTGETRTLTVGLYSLESSIKFHGEHNQLWIAYACTRKIKNSYDVQMDDIEMAVSVLADSDSPMVTHIGINRNFNYLIKAAKAEREREFVKTLTSENRLICNAPPEDAFKLHSNLAMNLHSFSAKVMQMNNSHRLYMITAPVKTMQQIMLRALPDHTFLGDNLHTANEIHSKLVKSNASLPSKLLTAGIKALKQEISELENQLYKTTLSEPEVIEQEIDELEKNLKILIKNKRIQQSTEIEEISQNLTYTEKSSPIIRDEETGIIQILSKDRQNVLFEYDGGGKNASVYNRNMSDEQTKKYDWFFHRDMRIHTINPFVSIDLEALAGFMKLGNPT